MTGVFIRGRKGHQEEGQENTVAEAGVLQPRHRAPGSSKARRDKEATRKPLEDCGPADMSFGNSGL